MSRSSFNLILLALALAASSVVAQNASDLNISSSPTPIGAGARAAGMADAFVAIADDATAASWNPAGLVQLERPEVSIVGAWNSLEEDFLSSRRWESHSTHQSSGTDLNFLSFVYPLGARFFDRNMTLSISYQRKYEFGRAFSTSRFGTGILSATRLNWRQSGSLSVVSPAVAIEVTQRLSAGVALNLWRDTPLSDNGWTQTTRITSGTIFGASAAFVDTDYRERYKNVEGENFTLGLLWKPNHRWSLGLRYDSAFAGEADYEGNGSRRDLRLPAAQARRFWMPTLTKERREIHFPDSLALGAAYRHNDRLTLSLDVTRTDWNDFHVRTPGGGRTSMVDGSDLNNPFTGANMDPTYTVRFGAEYVFVPKRPSAELPRLWTLRGGLFYDEEPASGKQNTVLKVSTKGDGKADSFYGLALGAGLLMHHRYNIDVAYQYRKGSGVNRDFLRGLEDFHEDVVQHRALLSAVIYF